MKKLLKTPQPTQSSEEMPSRNISSYFLLFIVGILPILISIVIHIRLGPEDYLRASAALKSLIRHWFRLTRVVEDTTLLSTIISEIKLLEILHSFVCIIGGAILFGMTIKGKNKSLVFMAIPYSVLALISVFFYLMNLDIWSAGGLFLYNRFYLLFFDICVMHGPLPIIIYSAILIGYIVFLWTDLKKTANT